MIAALALALAGAATPAVQHDGMTMPMGMPMPAPKAKPAPKPAPRPKAATPAKPKPKQAAAPKAAPMVMDRSAMEMPDQATTATPEAEPSPPMAGMDHAAMSGMDHGAMSGMNTSAEAAPTVETPPPASAGSGPARAADAIYGPDAMRGSRDQLRDEQGNQRFFLFMADRAEYRVRQGKDGYLWDLQGYYGGDTDKFWYKSEGEGSFGEPIERAELQALWSHAIGPWFDLQTGVRQDVQHNGRTHLVAGVQGLAPYRFDIDAAAFLSQKGELSARIEAELDQRITQRLRLQPRGEVNLAAQNTREIGVGAGLDRVELGLRLRYEIRREFAPYIGIAQEWRVGRCADYARAKGDDPSTTNFVAGVRLWF